MTKKEQQQTAPTNLAKLTVPRIESAYARTRLFERIEQARQDSRLIWISAEGGSGKTTLAVSYLQTYQPNSLWYQIDAGDADMASLFYYLGKAARDLAPQHRGLPMLTPEYLGAVEVYARNFFRELFSLFKGSPGVLVFDNYHDLPEDAPLHQLLVLACEELPPKLTIIVLSRKAPQTAFARLIANAQATTIETPEMRLTLEETGELATIYTGKQIDKEMIASLHRRTGGWAAGLRLILSQSQDESSEMLLEDTQPPEIIFDYFAAELWQQVDEATQDFLLRSALLPTITIETVSELTGDPKAEEIIKDLVRQNYFIVCHSGNVPTYQYHDLFRQFLLHKGCELFITDEHKKLVQNAAEILIRSGQYEHAAQLLIENSDHDSLQALIEQHAPILMAQGRLVTIGGWLQVFPVERVNTQPWLGYWLGYCRMPLDLFGARALFENAYAKFKEQGHALGQYLAWSGVAETFQYSWDDFSGIDPWVDELDIMQNEHPLEKLPEAAPRVICASLGMLSFVRSDRPEVRRLVTQAESMVAKMRGSSLHIVIAATLQLHYSWIGDLAKMNENSRELQQYIDNPDLEPLARLYGCLALAETGWFTDDIVLARKWGMRGLDYGDQHGIIMLKPLFHAQLLYTCQLDGDLNGAKVQLEQLNLCTMPERRLDVSHYHYHAAWLALEQGELKQAKEHAERSLALCEILQASFPIALTRIKLAEVLVVLEEYDAVPPLLEQAEAFAKSFGSPMLLFMSGQVYAFMLLRSGHSEECASRLTNALNIGRDQGYTTYAGRHCRHVAELCRFALEHDIETDYVQTLIQKRGLLPPSGESLPENWPLPVKIYTLGRFEIVRDGETLQFKTKVQKRPLELLKALIALGGRDVSTIKLGEALWPDTEGDAAQHNLKATLYRLRKLIGRDAVSVQDNQLGLNPTYCWTDVDALNSYLDGVSDDPADVDNNLEQLAEHVFGLYRGPFLSDHEASWAIVPREVMRGKFLKAVQQIAGKLHQQNESRAALKYYHRLLDLEPLREEIYVATMRCYKSIGQFSDADAVYQQLCTILHSQLGIEPSIETRALHKSLLSQQV